MERGDDPLALVGLNDPFPEPLWIAHATLGEPDDFLRDGLPGCWIAIQIKLPAKFEERLGHGACGFRIKNLLIEEKCRDLGHDSFLPG